VGDKWKKLDTKTRSDKSGEPANRRIRRAAEHEGKKEATSGHGMEFPRIKQKKSSSKSKQRGGAFLKTGLKSI